MLKPTTLKNGLTIIKIPNPKTNLFTAGFVARTGSAMEKDNFPLGISHLVEKMFWCGTDKHPSKRSLNTALEGLGGDWTSLTGHELTQYYLTVPSQHQYKAISMLAEVIQHSYFDARDINRERQAILEKVSSLEDIYTDEGSYLGLSNIYKNHGLGTSIYGELETVMTINQESIMNYLAHQYQPSTSYLILSGNFENRDATELLSQEWGYWNPKVKEYKDVENVDFETIGELPRVLYKQRGISQTEIVAGFLLGEGAEPKVLSEVEEGEKIDEKVVKNDFLQKWADLTILNNVLGQGLSSKLWLKGVEEEMFFSQVYSNLIRFSGTGLLEVVGTTDNSQFSFALECILSVLETLKKTTISINEMTKVKEYIKGRIIMEHEDLLSSTIWYVENFINSGLIFKLEDLIKKIDNAQAAPIRALASDLFKLDNFYLTTLGTAKQTRLVEKLIEKYLG